MKIILVRHGESESNAKKSDEKDSNLTKKGRVQAEHLARKLKNEKISKIYTSNLIRAKQTGDIISKIIRVPVKTGFEELNEYEGKHLRSFWRMFFNQRLKKLKRLLNKISREKEKKKKILIVAHGITNKIILSYFLKINKKKLLQFHQKNTCINIIKWEPDFKNWSLKCMNDISHLPEELK